MIRNNEEIAQAESLPMTFAMEIDEEEEKKKKEKKRKGKREEISNFQGAGARLPFYN